MCLIVCKEFGTDLPKEEHLKAGAKRNGDGIGIGYLKKGENKVKVKKDFKDIDETIKFLKENITKEDFLIVHFRFGTAGLKDEGNRHPFALTNDKELIRQVNFEADIIMAHNGVLTGYSGDKIFSDTQQYIMKVLNEDIVKNNIENTTIQQLILEAISPDRMIFLRKDGFSLLMGNWEKDKDDNCYYSNKGYEDYSTSIITRPLSYGLNNYYGYSNEWSGYDKKYTYDKKQKLRKDEFSNSCEGCGEISNLREVEYKHMLYSLCKSCRKKLGKPEFKLHTVYEKCDNCESYFGNKTLNVIGEDIKICNVCFESMQEI